MTPQHYNKVIEIKRPTSYQGARTQGILKNDSRNEYYVGQNKTSHSKTRSFYAIDLNHSGNVNSVSMIKPSTIKPILKDKYQIAIKSKPAGVANGGYNDFRPGKRMMNGHSQ